MSTIVNILLMVFWLILGLYQAFRISNIIHIGKETKFNPTDILIIIVHFVILLICFYFAADNFKSINF